MRQHLLIITWLLPLALAAQTPPPRKARPAPTGLKLISTTLEPPNDLGGRPVALTVQNLTDKTIVAVAALFEEFRADGTHTYPDPENAAHGVGMDFDVPDSTDPAHKDWIRPGQVTVVRLFAVGNPETASVKATITGVVYEDLTSEGSEAQMFFHARRDEGRKARESAAQEKSPEKRARFTRWAEWYEAHSVEVEK